MSSKKVEIAEAALRAYPATDYDEYFSQVAEFTGCSVTEVEEILHDLTVDKTLTDLHVMILNPTPRIEGDAKIVQPWYKKGEMWGQPRISHRP